MPTKFLSAGFALLLLGLSTHAAVVTETATFNSVPIGDPSFTLTLNKFDSTLGTLTGVTLTLDGVTSDNWFAFDNESCYGGSVTLKIGTILKAKTLLALETTLEAKPILIGTGTVKKDSKHDGDGDFKGKDSFAISGGASDSTSTLLSSIPYLAQYIGSSPSETFLVKISNTLFKSVSTSNLCGPTSACPGVFSGKFTIAYTYLLVPVPEAGTALFGLCVGLVALSRRPRARQS